MSNLTFQKIRNYKFQRADYYLMRGLTNKTLRDTVINSIAKSKGKSYKSTELSYFLDPSSLQTHIHNMNNMGFTETDYPLPEQKIQEIISYINTLECFDPYRKDLGAIDPDNTPAETHIANFDREDLIRSKTILDIANDSGLLTVAQDFLGATPTISNINMWWSFGGKSEAEEAQLFHRDVDDWKFCKFFIYLTDVSSENGPHTYVQKTSNSKSLRKIRRYTDQEIENTFGEENVKVFVRPKGSAFMVDTYGFHKGLLPKSGRRLLLQIQYSLNPLNVETYSPIQLEETNNQYHKYVNRLILKQ